MSEFKFSCPNCQQNIQATSEYSGAQINCPSCQTPLIVPPAPGAPEAAPEPAAAPSKPGARLSVAASTPQHQPSASSSAASYVRQMPVKKKKSKTGLIAGVSAGVIAAAAAVYFWPQLMKLVSHSNAAADAAAATNNTPPPPPPELTTEEIMDKVTETYKGMTDYAAKAQTAADIDMSAIVPGQKMNQNIKSSMQLGRTNYYRLDWEQNIQGQPLKGAAWNSGKGNYVGFGTVNPTKYKSRTEAMAAAAASFVISDLVAEIFYGTTNSVTANVKNFTKTNSPDLNTYDSYVLTGEENHQTLLLTINKKSFLVTQIVVKLGGVVDDELIKQLPLSQRAAAKMASKLKGTITESYTDFQQNQNLAASAFESDYRPASNPGAGAQAAGGRSSRPGSQAGQLVEPAMRKIRQRQQPQ